MNNKGQTLVVFVILLPIFLFILVLVVDYGLLLTEKRKLENNTYDAVNYYLKNKDEEDINIKVKSLLNNNLDNIEINIYDTLDYMEISVKDNYKSIYNKIFDMDLTVKYRGYKDSKEIIKG